MCALLSFTKVNQRALAFPVTKLEANASLEQMLQKLGISFSSNFHVCGA